MPAQVEIGSVIAGHRLEAVLGRGGMGVVYRAVDLELGRQVALKVISPEFAARGDFRDRFKREARAAAAIEHPNVIRILRAGDDDGVLFVSMQLLDGVDVRSRLLADGRLSVGLATYIVQQVAEGLDAAHAIGIVHRDVKPSNVMLNGERVTLTDFGLAKDLAADRSVTTTKQFFGTPAYVAPEQVQGRRVDARTDVYALGCVLYECLGGAPPFPRDSDMAMALAHVTAEVPSLTNLVDGLPPGLDGVVRRALAKDPGERYPSAGDLGRAAVAGAAQRGNPTAERTVAVGAAAATEPPAAAIPPAARGDSPVTTAVPPLPRGATVVGPARAVRERTERARRRKAEYVLTFRVERRDDGGTLLSPVPVEMRAASFRGSLSEGDMVRMSARRQRHGTLQPHRVQNLTTGGELRMPRRAGVPTRLLMLGVIVAILVVAVHFALPAITDALDSVRNGG